MFKEISHFLELIDFLHPTNNALKQALLCIFDDTKTNGSMDSF